MAYDRKAAKKKLRQRTQESRDRRDFSSIIKDGIPEWVAGDGKHKFDIIPYIVGKNHPDLEPGEPAYILIVWTHRGIGVNEDSFICLAKTYGKRCPVCEYRKRLMDSEDGDEDTIRSLRPTQRGIYNIVCYDTEEQRAKGVQVWNSSHWLVERILNSINTDESGEIITFADPDDGKRILFEKKGQKEATQYIGFRFAERDYKISDKILDSAYCLDEAIKIPTYEEVDEAFRLGVQQLTAVVEEKIVGVSEDDEDDVPEKIEKIKQEPGLSEDVLLDMTRNELKEYIRRNLLDIDADEIDKKRDVVKAIMEAMGGGKPECPEGGTFGKDYDNFRGCDDCDYRKKCKGK